MNSLTDSGFLFLQVEKLMIADDKGDDTLTSGTLCTWMRGLNKPTEPSQLTS